MFFAAIHNSVTAGCDVSTAQANAAAAVSALDPAVPQASVSATQVDEAIFAPEFMRQAAHPHWKVVNAMRDEYLNNRRQSLKRDKFFNL